MLKAVRSRHDARGSAEWGALDKDEKHEVSYWCKYDHSLRGGSGVRISMHVIAKAAVS